VSTAAARLRARLTPAVYAVPGGRHLVTAARFAIFGSLDVWDAALGTSDELTPPRRLGFVGGGDFHAVGRAFLSHFRELCKLGPEERVLDVGSGIGRMAVPLTTYLQPPGSYDGFDVVPSGIRWCQGHITPRFPHFRFQVADVTNRRYNPHGSITAELYRFPYEDGSFDFAFATSVFTHMLPPAVDRYVGELARVLRGGGRCLATFFLTSGGSGSADTALEFDVRGDGYWTANRYVPEAGIAYDEADVRAVFERHGLTLEEVHRGTWPGTPGLSFQDIVVARRA
jgi:SAM-dependent methyltransferase